MPFQDYYLNQFPHDIETLEYQELPEYYFRDPHLYGVDEYTRFFGGINWQNIERDIRNIDRNNLDYFILCLFMIVVTDSLMHTYYHDQYLEFRELTKYPKFGWPGMRPNHENPKKILSVPYERQVTRFNGIDVNEFVNFYTETWNNFFREYFPEISIINFIRAFLNDRDLAMSIEERNTFYGQFYMRLSNWEASHRHY